MDDDEILVALEAIRSNIVGVMMNIKSGYYNNTDDSVEIDVSALEDEMSRLSANITK